MTFQRIPNSELEQMWMSPAQVSRETGWQQNVISTKMRQYGKRGVMLAGRPAYYTSDVQDVIRQLEEQKEKYPQAPSILPQTAQG